MAVVQVTAAKAKLRERIRQIWTRTVFEPVFFLSEPADIPNDAKAPKLAILHFDAAQVTAGQAEPTELVRTLFEQASGAGEHRVYRNNFVFLLVDANQRDELIR